MEQSETNKARYNERTLRRRAARTRRSKFLSKVLFSVMGIGLMITVRTQPEAVMKTLTWVQSMANQQDAAADQTLPKVSRMPADKVTVRRGGSTQKPLRTAPMDASTQAEAVRAALQNMQSGNY